MLQAKVKIWQIAVAMGVALFIGALFFEYYYIIYTPPGALQDLNRLVNSAGAGVLPSKLAPRFLFNISTKSGNFVKPMAVAVAGDGRIYVVDAGDGRVKIFDANGKKVGFFGGFGVKPEQFLYPNAIAIDSNDIVYVGDFKKGVINVYNSEGQYLSSWDSETLGINLSPLSLAVDEKDYLYVADRGGKVVIISPKGNVMYQFGQPGSGRGLLSYPNGIDVSEKGDIYVSDSGNKRIQIFDAVGKLKKVLDGSQLDVAYPRGISLDKYNRLFITDLFGQKVSIVDANGQKVTEFGERGSDNGQFNFPNDVEIVGNRVYVADRVNKRVAVFAL